MGEDGRIVYKIVIDSTGAVVEAERAGKESGRGFEEGAKPHTGAFQQAMIGAARRIGEAFVDMAAKGVQGVEQIAKAGIEFNAKMEQYEVAFTTLLGNAEDARKAMAAIREDAAHTPFQVDDLTAANRLLISTGISAEQARKDVMNLANAISATGGGNEELSRMAVNLQQIKNFGKATALDIRQFAYAGIDVYGILADSMGVSTEQVKEMDISYEMLAEALEKAAAEGGKYAGAIEAQSQTFKGRISTLKDNAMLLAGSLTEDLFNQLSTTALPMVIGWVDTLLSAAETGGIEGAIQAAKDILSNLIQGFLEGLPQMLDTGVGLLVSLLEGFASSGAVGQIMATVLIVIRALLNALISHAPELLGAGVSLIMQLLVGIAQMIPTLLSLAGELVLRLFDAFIHADWSSIGHNIVAGIQNGIAGLWGTLVSQVQEAVSNLWESAKNALGIHSPSTKFKYIGEMSVEGTMEGFEDQEAEMTRVVHDVYSGLSDTAQDALRPVDVSYNGYGRENIEQQVSYTLQATGTTGGTTIIVPLSLDGREVARATAWSMGEQLAWEEL